MGNNENKIDLMNYLHNFLVDDKYNFEVIKYFLRMNLEKIYGVSDLGIDEMEGLSVTDDGIVLRNVIYGDLFNKDIKISVLGGKIMCSSLTTDEVLFTINSSNDMVSSCSFNLKDNEAESYSCTEDKECTYRVDDLENQRTIYDGLVRSVGSKRRGYELFSVELRRPVLSPFGYSVRRKYRDGYVSDCFREIDLSDDDISAVLDNIYGTLKEHKEQTLSKYAAVINRQQKAKIKK